MGTIWLALAAEAEYSGTEVSDYACTLLAAVVSKESAAFAQIGDGCIVVLDDAGDYSWVFWPDHGEYENETYFLTSPSVLAHLQVDQRPSPICEIALFSDGVQRLALHYETQTAHTPFFAGIFGYARAVDGDDAEQLSSAVRAFLSSDRVCERSDDDKTLVVAIRSRHTEECPAE